MHAAKDCCRCKKDEMAKANSHTARKAGKKPNPERQSFAQLSKKLDKLEKLSRKLLLSLVSIEIDFDVNGGVASLV